jgi:hypothetical protein
MSVTVRYGEWTITCKPSIVDGWLSIGSKADLFTRNDDVAVLRDCVGYDTVFNYGSSEKEAMNKSKTGIDNFGKGNK